MKHNQIPPRPQVLVFVAATAFATSLAVAQQQTPPPVPQQDSAGWHRMSDFNDGQVKNDPTTRRPLTMQTQQMVQQPQVSLPGSLSVPRGTYFTIRTTQVLSSNQNRAGDEFTATLAKPIVVNGIIVADRGQIVAGRVVEAQKAGLVRGQSKLAITLTELTFADGSQVPFRSQLTGFSGGPSIGRDATAVGVPAGIGAAIGGAAGGGGAAGIGAGAGAAVGLIGVLLTRGHPTVIYPESILTFRTEDPIQVMTERAPQAFRSVGQGDYEQPQDRQRSQPGGFMTRPPSYYAPSYFGPSYGLGYGSYWGGGFRSYYRPSFSFGYGGHRGYGRRR